MKRIAAIDWGLKRIGIAISDVNKKIALPFQTVYGGITEVVQVLRDKVELVIVGLPLLLSGKEGESAAAVKQFSKQLEEMLQVKVILIDERFSSKIANQNLKHLKRKDRTEKMDMTAATMLLQGYLDARTAL